jgi:hypothetical protein
MVVIRIWETRKAGTTGRVPAWAKPQPGVPRAPQRVRSSLSRAGPPALPLGDASFLPSCVPSITAQQNNLACNVLNAAQK